MATRKVFIDKEGKQLTPFLKDDKLIITIRDENETDSIQIDFPKEDAKEFIIELYRLGKKL